MGRRGEACSEIDIFYAALSGIHLRVSKMPAKGVGTWMLNSVWQITLDKHVHDQKTMMRLPMAGKYYRAIVYSCLRGWLRRNSGMPTSCASERQSQVPVDNRNLCRLDYRVAKATTVFYVKTNPYWWQLPSEHSRRQSAGISTSSADHLGWLGI